jgi:hypothetical protein
MGGISTIPSHGRLMIHLHVPMVFLVKSRFSIANLRWSTEKQEFLPGRNKIPVYSRVVKYMTFPVITIVYSPTIFPY